MVENRDYVGYLIGVGGILLTAFSFFIDKTDINRFLLLIWGAAALVVAIVFMFLNKINDLSDSVRELKKDFGISEQLMFIKNEIFLLKNKKGKATTLEDIIKVIFLIIIAYLIFKALGLIN